MGVPFPSFLSLLGLVLWSVCVQSWYPDCWRKNFCGNFLVWSVMCYRYRQSMGRVWLLVQSSFDGRFYLMQQQKRFFIITMPCTSVQKIMLDYQFGVGNPTFWSALYGLSGRKRSLSHALRRLFFFVCTLCTSYLFFVKAFSTIYGPVVETLLPGWSPTGCISWTKTLNFKFEVIVFLLFYDFRLM